MNAPGNEQMNISQLVEQIHPGWQVHGVESVLQDVLA